MIILTQTFNLGHTWRVEELLSLHMIGDIKVIVHGNSTRKIPGEYNWELGDYFDKLYRN